MMSRKKIIGTGRIVDVEGTTCRVRLCDAEGVPNGKVLTDVILTDAPEMLTLARQHRPVFAELSDHELDTIARQNLYYNVFEEVTILHH